VRRQSTILVPALMTLAMVVGACSSATATPQATAAPTVAATAAPTDAATGGATATPASVSKDPFAGEPFALTLPPGWNGFNLSDPAAQAGIDQFVAANPNLAGSVAAFKAIPGVRIAVNPVLGNILLVITTPSNGITLDVLSQAFNTQFQAAPGLLAAPSPEPVTLAGGPATHWQLLLQANKPSGGTVQVSESIYALVSSKTAVILEFVVPQGGPVPDEQTIANSFRFTEP